MQRQVIKRKAVILPSGKISLVLIEDDKKPSLRPYDKFVMNRKPRPGG